MHKTGQKSRLITTIGPSAGVAAVVSLIEPKNTRPPITKQDVVREIELRAQMAMLGNPKPMSKTIHPERPFRHVLPMTNANCTCNLNVRQSRRFHERKHK